MTFLGLIGITVLLIILGGVVAFLGEAKNSEFFVGLGANIAGWTIIFAIPFLIIAPIGSYTGQISDVEEVKAQEAKIEIQYDRLDRLSGILEKYDYPNSTTLANSDTPIGSVVKEIAEVENDIADRREKVENIKRCIRERGAWFYGFTTEWYPLEDE